jgi:VCBS repeat-containing protein
MEALSGRRTLGEVLRFLEEDRGSQASSASVPAPSPEPGDPPARLGSPFLRSVDKLVPGVELQAECRLDLAEDLFLEDHALGRRLATTMPELRGLPVVPMTMGMEMLAEAALAVATKEARRVVGMRDVRAYRWMMLENDDGLVVSITAKRAASDNEGDAFHASVSVDGTPVIEGTVLLAPDYPDAPAAPDLSLSGERPSTWTQEALYEEIMFHGKRFQGVSSMDRWGEDGATATLSTLAQDRLFASTDRPALALDPVLLDQPGQVVGFWTAEHLERGFVVFPFHLERLELYAAPGTTPAELECRARIRLVSEDLVDSDLDVVRPDGKLACRLVGWKDRRFDVPREFLRFLHRPVDERLTQSWPQALASVPDSGSFGCYRLALEGFPQNFFAAHGAVWQRALALLILGPDERRHFGELRLPPAERLSWLLERLVAKDAVRSYVRERSGLALAPADIELPRETGDSVALDGPWREALPGPLALALARSGEAVVAVVGRIEAGKGLGVVLGRLGTDEAGTVALTSSEEQLLGTLGSENGGEWTLRLRAAKQAAIKGLAERRGSASEIVIERLDPASQAVWLRLNGDQDRRVAYTAREGDLVVATYVPFYQRGEDFK